MDFSEIKELKFIFPQKKFCYFLTKLKAELWLMPGIRFFQYDSYQQGSIAPHSLKGQKNQTRIAPHALKGQKARSPGHRPGYHCISLCALKGQKLYKVSCSLISLIKNLMASSPHHIFSKLSPDFLACFKI